MLSKITKWVEKTDPLTIKTEKHRDYGGLNICMRSDGETKELLISPDYTNLITCQVLTAGGRVLQSAERLESTMLLGGRKTS